MTFHHECRVRIMLRSCVSVLHPKGPKMWYGPIAKYMKKTFVSKWVKCFRRKKHRWPASVQKTDEKRGQSDFIRVWRILVYHCVVGKRFYVKSLNISCDTIRKLLLAYEISKHSEETATVKKTRRKKIHLGERKFGPQLGTR